MARFEFPNSRYTFYESGKSKDKNYTFYKNYTDNVTLAFSGLKLVVTETVVIEGKKTENDYGVTIWVDYQDVDCNSIEFQKMILSDVKGITAERADEIFEDFGFKSIVEIAAHLEAGKKIAGIGKSKMKLINEKLQDAAEENLKQKLTFLLGNRNLSKKVAKHIAELKELYDHPYEILHECGVGFLRSDDIATQKLSISLDNKERNQYLIRHKFNQFNTKSANYVELDAFKDYLMNDVEIHCEVDEYLHDNKLIVVEAGAVYLNEVYEAETETPFLLKSYTHKFNIDNIEESIDMYQKFNDIDLDTTQIDAIEAASQSPISIVTGGAGTGKTTISKGVISVLSQNGYQVVQLAPTGRASVRMTECTGLIANTIHSFCCFAEYIAPENPDALRWFVENYQVSSRSKKVVIIDEFSMVDQLLFYRFLQAVEYVNRELGLGIVGIVMVGDPFQLPSVGCGKVLHDLIESKCFCHTHLTKTFRQAEKSPIIRNSKLVRDGKVIEFLKDREFYVNGYTDASLKKIVATFRSKYSNDIDFHRNFQICTALNASVDHVNSLYKVSDKPFAVGDKVINTKNNKEYQVSNGDMGIVESIRWEKKQIFITVFFYDLKKRITFESTENLRLAYACTVHKLQGSEFKHVVVLIDKNSILLESKMFYTAITRAKENCIILAVDSQMISSACKRNNQWMRLSQFASRLDDCFNAK